MYPPENINCGTEFVFTQRNVGPVDIPNRNAKPIEYFFLFITDNIVDILVRETNRYSDNFLLGKEDWMRDHPRSTYLRWKRMTSERMRKFLALSLCMGLVRIKNVKDYWNTDPTTRQPFHSSIGE